MNRAMSAKDWARLTTLSLLWSGAFFLTEVALEELPPLTLVLGRIGFAALALHGILWLRGERVAASARLWGAFLVMGALNNFLPFSLIVSGQVHIEGGLAAILNGTTPLFSVVLAHFLTAEERLSAGRVAGLLLGLGGVALLVGPSALAGLGAQGWAQLAVLAAAASYACAAFYGRRFRGLSPLVIAAGQLTAAALLILPLALLFDRPWTLQPGLTTWAAWLGLALPATALGYVIYFRILASAGATNLMLVTLLTPGAVLLGALFLDERIGASSIAGMLLIGAGLLAIDGRLARGLGRARQDAADASAPRPS